jgi:Uma2 family endonuclease
VERRNSTAKYDREDKFDHYKQISSLREYVLISCPERGVEVRSRGDDGRWTSVIFRDGEVAELRAIEARLDVSELYDAAAEPRA